MEFEASKKKLNILLKKTNKNKSDLVEINRLKNNISSIKSKRKLGKIKTPKQKKVKAPKVQVTIKQLHKSYLMICEMDIPFTTKHRMFNELMSLSEYFWRVEGITDEALKIFQQHNFLRKSKMGINRSHILQRIDTNRKLLGKPIKNLDEWWKAYYSKDATRLATSSENGTNKFSKVYKINPKKGMFKASGFSWYHGESEKTFLTNLWNKRKPQF